MTGRRWSYVAAGVGVLLLAGVVYAWSVLSVSIAAEFPQWSKAKLSLTFTLVMSLFCTGQIICGFAGNRLSPRNGIWLGGALLLAGFLISAYMRTAAMLYLGFGVLCGIGSGIAYISVMSSVVKWFPDKRGLVSGILLMGFGFSSFIIGKLFHTYTPAVVGGWRSSFIVLGVVTFAVLFICGFFVKRPDEAGAENKATEGITTGQMLKKPKFWLYYVWEIFLTGCGLMVISQASGMVKESSAAVAPAAVATIVGLISIFNGLGRVAFGSMYDKSGRRASMSLICLCFTLAMGLLIWAEKSNSIAILICAFVLVGLGYGGVPVCNSAFVGSSFGMAHYQTNFPVCNSAMLPASFAGTLAGALYDSSKSFVSVFIVIIVLSVIGAICSESITALDKRK